MLVSLKIDSGDMCGGIAADFACKIASLQKSVVPTKARRIFEGEGRNPLDFWSALPTATVQIKNLKRGTVVEAGTRKAWGRG